MEKELEKWAKNDKCLGIWSNLKRTGLLFLRYEKI